MLEGDKAQEGLASLGVSDVWSFTIVIPLLILEWFYFIGSLKDRWVCISGTNECGAQLRSEERLPGRPPTINQNRLAGDQRCSGGGKKYNCPCHFHRLADTVQRCDSFQCVRVKCRVRKCALRARCADERRRHGIHRDPVLAPLHR